MIIDIKIKRIASYASAFLKFPYLYSRSSYSQEGEDLILLKLFDYTRNGFYVDIGVHHPYRHSNTYKLYKLGWTGINIDPDKNAIDLFNLARPSDINLNLAISRSRRDLQYYIFEDSALNTCLSKQAKVIEKTHQSKLVKIIKVNTHSLREVLNKYLQNQKNVDFMNIDAEGSDLEILKSNDWMKVRPKVIAVEIINPDYSKSNIYKYLIKKGYKLIAHTINTSFFLCT